MFANNTLTYIIRHTIFAKTTTKAYNNTNYSPAKEEGIIASPPLAKPSFIASHTVSLARCWGVNEGIVTLCCNVMIHFIVLFASLLQQIFISSAATTENKSMYINDMCTIYRLLLYNISVLVYVVISWCMRDSRKYNILSQYVQCMFQ